MDKKKKDAEKNALLRDFKAFTLKLLRTSPVIGLEELERKIHHEFADQIAAGGFAEPLKSGRAEWANLVDWVKADLTKQGRIKYFTVQKNTHIAFLVPCGEVNEIALVTFADAIRLRNAIIAVAENGGRPLTPVADEDQPQEGVQPNTEDHQAGEGGELSNPA
jgi:hypothetical protein